MLHVWIHTNDKCTVEPKERIFLQFEDTFSYMFLISPLLLFCRVCLLSELEGGKKSPFVQKKGGKKSLDAEIGKVSISIANRLFQTETDWFCCCCCSWQKKWGKTTQLTRPFLKNWIILSNLLLVICTSELTSVLSFLSLFLNLQVTVSFYGFPHYLNAIMKQKLARLSSNSETFTL